MIPIRFLRWVREEGFAHGDALEWLTHAIKSSARITHVDGNKRFGDLLLNVEGNRLTNLSVFEPKCKTCSDTKVFSMGEDTWPCPDCKVIDKPRSRRHNKGR